MCEQVVCVSKLCVVKLCVSKLCVSKLCVEGGRAGGRADGRTGGRRDTEPKTRTPHKDVGNHRALLVMALGQTVANHSSKGF